LPSISSILLFNTVDNPYKKYESLDNLQGVAGKDRERVTAEVAAAPQTMIDGDMLPMFSGPDYAFRPKMSDVPTFALPTMLPDLPGVADISWSMDGNKQSIAPSQAPISSFNANALQVLAVFVIIPVSLFIVLDG
jgi:WAS family protein 1